MNFLSVQEAHRILLQLNSCEVNTHLSSVHKGHRLILHLSTCEFSEEMAHNMDEGHLLEEYGSTEYGNHYAENDHHDAPTMNENYVDPTAIAIIAVSGLVYGIMSPFRPSDHLGKATVFISGVGFYSCTLFLMMMTVHRYLVVVHQLSDPGSKAGCYGIAITVTTWTVSFSAAIPVPTGYLELGFLN
ncbi:hypothetical protein MATL_G00253680 [Megalops atlanticus]|uniref:Uncharacterized protein n=1 Tax=Megalops atlanticus TaxID=7932 RepID=A0A9D3PB43_MEGAT|nr:hypothetical protein MATL_G00253680 [Megalops atlanticus]